MRCGLCDKETHRTILTSIQLAGKFELMYVCPDCKVKRDRELEMCREDYKRITEAKIET